MSHYCKISKSVLHRLVNAGYEWRSILHEADNRPDVRRGLRYLEQAIQKSEMAMYGQTFLEVDPPDQKRPS